MQLFQSQPSRSRHNDIELGVPLVENHRHNIASDRLSSNASPKPFYTKSSNPRIAAPSSHLPIFSIATRRPWRISWQILLIFVLSIYILYTWLQRAGVVIEQQGLAEYGGGPPRTDLTHLIMVAGHAIWMGGKSLGVDEVEWTLLPYQKGAAPTFIKHIEEGAKEATNHENSLLVFSGGETRSFAGPLSEAQSYWSLAFAKGLIATTTPIFNRTTTEEFSRDSYENLLFSICRFHEYTSNYPSRITVIGYEFKRKRFESIHRAALRFPLENFKYIGIDPPAKEGVDFLEGEVSNSLKPFEQDPYGCWHKDLMEKRVGRNPFRVRHGYEASSPEIAGLLGWCGEEEMKKGREQWYPGKLPWN